MPEYSSFNRNRRMEHERADRDIKSIMSAHSISIHCHHPGASPAPVQFPDGRALERTKTLLRNAVADRRDAALREIDDAERRALFVLADNLGFEVASGTVQPKET